MNDRDLEQPLYAVSTIVDGQRVTIEAHRRRRSSGDSWRAQSIKPRMYVSCDETLLENLMNRTTRPVNVWGKTIRKALKQLELPGTIGWYSRAGCSCPCSPGFIWTNAPAFSAAWYMDKANKLGDHVYDAGYTMRQYDVHVTLEGAPTVRFDPESQAEQLHRLEQLANDPTLPLEALAGTRL